MTAFSVTLKSEVKLGTFYWVVNVNADSEDEAINTAENLFLEQLNSSDEWDFTDYDVEKL